VTEEERHNREMNMNAHLVWAMAMWGSGERAKIDQNYLCAAIAYYYASFHAAFSLVNTDPTFPLSQLSQMRHSTLQGWLERRHPGSMFMYFGILRDLREGLNYLGAGSPANKLQVVRGHPLLFRITEDSEPITFFDMVGKGSELSKLFIQKAIAHIEEHCRAAGWRGPVRGTAWLEEYLQEDLLITVLPRQASGIANEILRIAFSLLPEDQ
jgi:hypothetical protein